MDMWLLYLLTIAESVKGLAFYIAIFACPAAVVSWIAYYNECGWLKSAIICSFISVIAISATVLIPDRQGIYMILGGYYLSNINNIEELPQNVVGAANKFLTNYGKEEVETNK